MNIGQIDETDDVRAAQTLIKGVLDDFTEEKDSIITVLSNPLPSEQLQFMAGRLFQTQRSIAYLTMALENNAKVAEEVEDRLLGLIKEDEQEVE